MTLTCHPSHVRSDVGDFPKRKFCCRGVVPAGTGASFNSRQDDYEPNGGSNDRHDIGRTSAKCAGSAVRTEAWKKAAVKVKGDHMGGWRASRSVNAL
jgi:hypothetical protein